MKIMMLKKGEIVMNRESFIKGNELNEELANLIIEYAYRKDLGSVIKCAEELRAFSQEICNIYGSD